MALEKPHRFPLWKVIFINAFDEEVHCTYATEAQAVDNMNGFLALGQTAWIAGPYEDYVPFEGN